MDVSPEGLNALIPILSAIIALAAIIIGPLTQRAISDKQLEIKIEKERWNDFRSMAAEYVELLMIGFTDNLRDMPTKEAGKVLFEKGMKAFKLSNELEMILCKEGNCQSCDEFRKLTGDITLCNTALSVCKDDEIEQISKNAINSIQVLKRQNNKIMHVHLYDKFK